MKIVRNAAVPGLAILTILNAAAAVGYQAEGRSWWVHISTLPATIWKAATPAAPVTN